MQRLSAVVLILVGFAVPALAADVYRPAPPPVHHAGTSGGHWARLPLCDESKVLKKIAKRFAYGDRRIMHTGLTIAGIDGIRERALRAGGPSLIDRRYCGGTAWLSDGRTSEVVYLIEAKQGFAAWGWNVESCLPAYDPYKVYGAACRSVRP